MAIMDPILALPKPQKIAIGVVGLVALAALAYFFLFQPKWDERDALWNRNEGLRAKVVQARADEANLRPFRVQAAALRKRLEAAQERLPSSVRCRGCTDKCPTSPFSPASVSRSSSPARLKRRRYSPSSRSR